MLQETVSCWHTCTGLWSGGWGARRTHSSARTAQHGSEWYGTAQINTAQHSMAQLSTAAADPPRTPSSSAPAAWDKPWLCCWGQQGAGRDHAEAGAQGAHEDRSPHGVARCLQAQPAPTACPRPLFSQEAIHLL
uniref:Uncharacterized protein n=1 Tax=Anas platyrhynchos platyrhynchos TaxID=8840 RepID=A0A493SZS1_ANAPP